MTDTVKVFVFSILYLVFGAAGSSILDFGFGKYGDAKRQARIRQGDLLRRRAKIRIYNHKRRPLGAAFYVCEKASFFLLPLIYTVQEGWHGYRLRSTVNKCTKAQLIHEINFFIGSH